jgi:hypothetical protein
LATLGVAARGSAGLGRARQGNLMGKRRADAGSRKFFDQFEKVSVSRLRANGTIDPAKRQALIPFPNGTTKLIGTAHTHFPNGGGWSYFICPKCAKLASKLYLIGDAPRCSKCCNAMNIWHTTQYGFGRGARREARDRLLDQLVAKLETSEPLRLKPTPSSWGRGKAQRVYNSQRLQQAMRSRLVELRLEQLAYQYAKDEADDEDTLATHQPIAAARELIDLTPIWRANSPETLEQALDKAQTTILAALESDDPQRRLNAAKLMLRTKQARDRGLT